jgi:hypothetical protein
MGYRPTTFDKIGCRFLGTSALVPKVVERRQFDKLINYVVSHSIPIELKETTREVKK